MQRLSGETIAERLNGSKARVNAFDSLRLVAALTVIWSHSYLLTSGNYDLEPLYWASSGQFTLGSLSVGVFFVISGLFISASFDRSKSVREFVRNRALRIMPALIVVIALLALVIGPILTTVPVHAYFGNVETWVFFRNIVFLPIAFHLPGVFENHTVQTVNESIWTLKFEIACYAIAALTLMVRKWTKPAVVAGWVASFLIVRYWPNANGVSGAEYYIVAIARMFRFFGAGMLMYLYSDKILLSRGLALVSALLPLAFLGTTWFVEATAFFGSYSVIAYGYLAPQRFRNLAERGDVSYGVYIYGWPIQQMLWPLVQGQTNPWLLNTLMAVPLSYAMGWVSWLLVEKPFLARKKVGTKQGPTIAQPAT